LHALAARSELELRLAGRSGRLCSLGLAKTNDDVMAKAQSSREQQENIIKKNAGGFASECVCANISESGYKAKLVSSLPSQNEASEKEN